MLMSREPENIDETGGSKLIAKGIKLSWVLNMQYFLYNVLEIILVNTSTKK